MSNIKLQISKLKYSKELIFLLCICFISSCIPTKKVAFVDNKENETGKYSPNIWSYKVKEGDRFYIKITDPLSEVSLGEGDIKSGGNASQGNVIIQQPTINDFVIQADGTIDLPILGEIQIGGTELSKLSDLIRDKCKGFIANPSIKVFMTNYNVTVLGEINNPGFYQLITQQPSFFDAIGLAGDLTDFANRSEIQFQRKDNQGNLVVDYVDILDPNFISSPYYYIHPNDVIHIRPLKVKKYSNGNALPLILSTITTILTIFTIARTN